MKFPIEIGLPRRIVYDKREYLSFINNNNGKKKSIFQSLYSCRNINNKINYDNVEIDKLFFDFDSEDAWIECNKFHQYLNSKKLRHRINMSGRGFHLFLFCKAYSPKNSKSCLYNAQMHFINELKLNCDTSIVGDIKRLHRVVNTFNLKARRFCVALPEKEFEKGDTFCKGWGLTQHQIRMPFMGGDNLLDLHQFDKETERDTGIIIENLEQSSSENIIIKDAPKFINDFLQKKNLNYQERYLIILYFKEKGYTKKEVYEILKQHLTPKKFHHCIVEERQLQYLFERNDLMFPSRTKLKDMGIKFTPDEYSSIYK